MQMTQSRLGQLAELGTNYIPRVERGELVPSIETAWRISRALGKSIDELCGRGDTGNPIEEGVRTIEALSDADLDGLRRVIRAVDGIRRASRPTPQLASVS